MSTQYNLHLLPTPIVLGEYYNGTDITGFDVDQMQAYAIAAIEQDRAARVPAGLTLAVIGQKHFGNPIPQEWYQAAHDLLAAAPQLPPVQKQWQAIESAPRDGRTLLLGYFNLSGKWRTMRGQWMSQDYIEEYWEDPEGVEAGWFETCVEADDIPNCWPTDPTHWMLLPAVPLQATQQGEK